MYKKGGLFNRETMLVAMGVIVAAIAIFGMLNSAKNVLDREALFKNYMARDIALIMDAVYAAPGEVEYTYSLNPKHSFYVKLKEGLVEVSSDINFKPDKTFSYRFAYDTNIGFEFTPYGFTLPKDEDLAKDTMEVKISKTNAPAKVAVKFER